MFMYKLKISKCCCITDLNLMFAVKCSLLVV